MKKYSLWESDFGPLVIIWQTEPKLILTEVILPAAREKFTPESWGGCRIFPDEAPAVITERIRACLAGDGDGGELDFAAMGLNDFPRRVLLACRRIPRGKVVSYATLALAAGRPAGARAVGGVMAANPLPLIIPCHRVVRSDGRPGEFGGGPMMKRELLAREGIAFNARGRVPAHFYLPPGSLNRVF